MIILCMKIHVLSCHFSPDIYISSNVICYVNNYLVTPVCRLIIWFPYLVGGEVTRIPLLFALYILNMNFCNNTSDCGWGRTQFIRINNLRLLVTRTSLLFAFYILNLFLGTALRERDVCACGLETKNMGDKRKLF